MITQTHMGRQRIILEAGYADFSKGLHWYARSKVSDTELADDLIQNTFLKTWTYLKRGGNVEMLEAFLYHILKALIIDEYRKRKSISLDVLLGRGFDPTQDETQHLVNILDGKQVAALIIELPVRYRKVMQLRYIEDLSIKEISLKTGQTKNAITVQSYRGLAKLKVLYELREKTARNRRDVL